MLTRIIRTIGVTGIALLLILSHASGTGTQAQSEDVYLALGDSIAAGLLASLPTQRGYSWLLQDLMQQQRLAADAPGAVDLINLAEQGETVDSFVQDGQLDDALDAIGDVQDGALRTVTLTIGGNDILALWEANAAERQDELERFATGFDEIVGTLADALEGQDPDVIVTTYYDVSEGDPEIEGSDSWWLAQFNHVIRETAEDAGFSVVDLESIFRGRIGSLTWFPADIHPNNAGHQLIAREIWQSLGYDQDPPEVEITMPDELNVRNRTPTIHAVVQDDVGVDRVVLAVDGEPQKDLTYVPDRDAWVGVWNGRAYEQNQVELSVIAADLAGNSSEERVSIILPPPR